MSKISRTTARVTAWLLIALLTAGERAAFAASDYFGQVTFNGLAVPGATVTAAQGETKVAATTDQDGIFLLASLAEGVWHLTVEMLSFATLMRDITVPAGEEPPPIELALRSFAEIEKDLSPQRQAPVQPASTSAAAGATPQQAAGRGAAATNGGAAAAGAFQRTGVSRATPPPRPAGQLAELPDAAPAVDRTG